LQKKKETTLRAPLGTFRAKVSLSRVSAYNQALFSRSSKISFRETVDFMDFANIGHQRAERKPFAGKSA
jgi:hypothetical protein